MPREDCVFRLLSSLQNENRELRKVSRKKKFVWRFEKPAEGIRAYSERERQRDIEREIEDRRAKTTDHHLVHVNVEMRKASFDK